MGDTMMGDTTMGDTTMGDTTYVVLTSLWMVTCVLIYPPSQ
jgi:hypothetical protein